MGAKTWMLVYSTGSAREALAAGHPIDRTASAALAAKFGIDYPSQLPQKFLGAATGQTVYLHAMHSVVDWFAFAVWQDGRLVRALSLSPDSGILEDIGPRLAFELPYWDGKHPVNDPDENLDDEDRYPFVFHPLDLGEAALGEFFGYHIEGDTRADVIDPETMPLLRFERAK